MPGPETSPARVLSEVIGVTLLALVVSLVIGAVFLIPLAALGYSLDTTFALAVIVVLGQVGFLVVGYVYINRRNVKVSFEVSCPEDIAYMIVGTFLVLITVAGLSLIISYLYLIPDSVIEEATLVNPTFLIFLAVLSVILVAPAGELLFRGTIQGRLREGFGPVPSIVVSSVLFGSLHLFNYTGGVLPVAMTVSVIVVIGCILGMLYERTDNLAVPILVHGIYNVVLLLSSYLAMV
ncbi:MAG: type II CAAX endopeptidase family protein [Thermoplasmata archaeon]